MNRFLNPREGNATTHNKNIAQNCRCYIVAIPFSRYDVFHLRGHADIRSGQPCFYGTRVPIKILFDYIEGGEPLDDFLEGFPDVTREQALAVLEAAKINLLHDLAA